MIKHLLLSILFLFPIESNSQEYVYNFVHNSTFNYQPISLNQHHFKFETSILDYFVPTFSSTTEIIGNVLEVKMYYDITEQVFNFGNLNFYTNFVDYNQLLASNITQIKMSSNVIMIEDNPPYNPIPVDNLYIRIFDLENLSINTNSLTNTNVFPNPTKGVVNFNSKKNIIKIEVFNNLGEKIKAFQSFSENKINLSYLDDGIYFINFLGEDLNETRKVILKK